MRVLLFYAPSRWFFKGRVKRVPPWAATLIGCFLALIAAAFYFWPTASLEVLEGFGIVCGVVLVAVAIASGVSYVSHHNPGRARKAAKWTALPLWIIPYLLFRAGKWVYKRFESKFQAFGYWMTRTKYKGVTPFAMMLVILLLFDFGINLYFNPLGTLLFVGILVGVIFLCIGIVVAIVWVEEKIGNRRDRVTPTKPPSRIRRTYSGVADTVKLGATYVMTKKKGSRICPLLNFEEPPAVPQ
jgi:uncharacterized membrane protein HdeD (DUF308 family)